tara:strand:- start:1367 stop:2014 length:648 start_codon:yes stop_codon:yes gene_type:complete
MSVLQVDTIKDETGANTLVTQSGSNFAWGSGVPSGSIVQVQSTQYGTASGENGRMATLAHDTDYVVQASGSTSGGGQSGILDVNITPKITGSKIWLQAHWFGEMDDDRAYDTVFFFWRSSSSTHTKLASYDHSGGSITGISVATQSNWDQDASTTPETCMMQYFDTHGISAGTQITYKVGFRTRNTGMDILTTNRCIGNSQENGVSSICAIELAP